MLSSNQKLVRAPLSPQKRDGQQIATFAITTHFQTEKLFSPPLL